MKGLSQESPPLKRKGDKITTVALSAEGTSRISPVDSCMAVLVLYDKSYFLNVNETLYRPSKTTLGLRKALAIKLTLFISNKPLGVMFIIQI